MYCMGVILGFPSSSGAVMQRQLLMLYPVLLILSWFIVPSVQCSLLTFACILAPGVCVVLSLALVSTLCSVFLLPCSLLVLCLSPALLCLPCFSFCSTCLSSASLLCSALSACPSYWAYAGSYMGCMLQSNLGWHHLLSLWLADFVPWDDIISWACDLMVWEVLMKLFPQLVIGWSESLAVTGQNSQLAGTGGWPVQSCMTLSDQCISKYVYCNLGCYLVIISFWSKTG